MSAIGGIVDFKSGDVDFTALNRMRLAMSLRGRFSSSAYLCGGVGMIFNSSDEICDDQQPAVFERGQSFYALCIDGDEKNTGAVFENYRLCGAGFIGRCKGRFALALFDGEKNILLLARDKDGRKPLYYRIYKGKIFFSSDLKGIFRATGESPNIDREALVSHICSPLCICSAPQIYSDICEVSPGECVIFSSEGISRCFIGDMKEPYADVPKITDSPIEPYLLGSTQKLEELLGEYLLAFDYPQFDCFMPYAGELISEAALKGKRRVAFTDPVRRRELSYAYEREDRLGALYGIDAVGVSVRRDRELPYYEEEKRIEKRLASLMLSMSVDDVSLLSAILGNKRMDMFLRRAEQSARGYTPPNEREQRIRTMGMLYQTVNWFKASKLTVKSEERKRLTYL